MPEKPTYLGLLNAIAVAEARAHRYLGAWIAVTPDPRVRDVLETVTWREGEHGMSFARRIDELGFAVRDKDDPSAGSDLAVAGSTELSDIEKMEHFGLHALDGVLSGFDDIFQDHSIDIRTGELLGRYIAEEFDTARLLARCYEELCAARDRSASPANA